jgi:UDP-N-acetylmuramoylalanine--D-glutamate ligase
MAIKSTSFEFESYAFITESKTAEFKYKINFENQPSLEFTETLEFYEDLKEYSVEYLEKVMDNLHIALGLSYYKLYIPQELILNAPLNQEQANFWNNVYQKGLGEFLYQNNLDPGQIAKFPYEEVQNEPIHIKNTNRSLVGIGGGKDSIVTGELFKENNHEFDGFIIETEREYPIANEVMEVMEIKGIKVRRKLDPKIFGKHPESYNGHIPISAIFAFIGLLTACLYDYSYFVVSNEYSSNFGNLEYKGLTINHQWSKSQEFEEMFQSYTNKFIGRGITYFSAIRPFYEIRIVEMFTKYPKYFKHFSSCNNAYKVHKERSDQHWCNSCAKCVFIYTLLSAYLEPDELEKIFGENLFDREDLLQDFKDILGLGNIKPFDCVGTFDECQTALKFAEPKFKDSYIIKELSSQIKIHDHVFRTYTASTIPTQFWNTGYKSVYILGYGKEGKATEQFIKNHYPNIQIKIGDKILDDNYLKNQINYDFAIKTPGIHKDKLEIPYTTATNLFLSKYKDQIIGVTGSKGKSTTTSLIHHIFKTAGKSTKILGNIGTPMLSEYENIKKDDILIVELSSYQLDDVKHSPHVAVLTNLFPEHMDFHGSEKKYYEAKKNIIRFQTNSDHFVASKNEWAPESQFTDYTKFKPYDSYLLGDHNKQNIKAAIATAKLFNIEDSIIEEAIASFKGLPHRLEFVGEFKGIKFYDDAISTTPESTIEAIKALPETQTIFLGGQDRGYDFANLETIIRSSNIKNIVLFPDSGSKILKSTEGLEVLETDSMKEAVQFAYDKTQPGQTCLLSCASPSYSLWTNYIEKGEQFKELVKAFS